MRRIRIAARQATTVAGAAALLVAGVNVAPAAAANPPSCVERSTWEDGAQSWAKANNTCSSRKTFYFQWDWAVDGDCKTLKAGYYRSEWRVRQANFRSLVNC
ncbi:hypothetical protein [Streptomyces yerevanensis]|uniref:hypothetical protein n=1 Tax=Streptomyces yerevanensis TaxID=66378 RepID=UPI0005278AC2|nr:hypothetical protein [Streptomyces yerevanensis]